MHIFIGLFLTALGLVMVLKTEPIYQFTGSSRWAEEHLGAEGGTRLLIKFLGIVFIFFGFATMTGVVNGILYSIAQLLIPGK